MSEYLKPRMQKVDYTTMKIYTSTSPYIDPKLLQQNQVNTNTSYEKALTMPVLPQVTAEKAIREFKDLKFTNISNIKSCTICGTKLEMLDYSKAMTVINFARAGVNSSTESSSLCEPCGKRAWSIIREMKPLAVGQTDKEANSHWDPVDDSFCEDAD